MVIQSQEDFVCVYVLINKNHFPSLMLNRNLFFRMIFRKQKSANYNGLAITRMTEQLLQTQGL